jgi:hypothetical protein
MAFRVKNLMIQVLPDASAKAPLAVNAFGVCFPTHFCFPTSLPFPIPPKPGGHGPAEKPPDIKTDPIIIDPAILSDPAALATLKAQLQSTLDALTEQEKLLTEQTSIKTVEEAQALEDHLTAAIEEVRLQKAQLQNKDATGGPG